MSVCRACCTSTRAEQPYMASRSTRMRYSTDAVGTIAEYPCFIEANLFRAACVRATDMDDMYAACGFHPVTAADAPLPRQQKDADDGTHMGKDTVVRTKPRGGKIWEWSANDMLSLDDDALSVALHRQAVGLQGGEGQESRARHRVVRGVAKGDDIRCGDWADRNAEACHHVGAGQLPPRPGQLVDSMSMTGMWSSAWCIQDRHDATLWLSHDHMITQSCPHRRQARRRFKL